MAEKKRELSEENQEAENVDPNASKKKKPSLSLKNKKGSRFTTISEEQLESMSSYIMPKKLVVHGP